MRVNCLSVSVDGDRLVMCSWLHRERSALELRAPSLSVNKSFAKITATTTHTHSAASVAALAVGVIFNSGQHPAPLLVMNHYTFDKPVSQIVLVRRSK